MDTETNNSGLPIILASEYNPHTIRGEIMRVSNAKTNAVLSVKGLDDISYVIRKVFENSTEEVLIFNPTGLIFSTNTFVGDENREFTAAGFKKLLDKKISVKICVKSENIKSIFSNKICFLLKNYGHSLVEIKTSETAPYDYTKNFFVVGDKKIFMSCNYTENLENLIGSLNFNDPENCLELIKLFDEVFTVESSSVSY